MKGKMKDVNYDIYGNAEKSNRLTPLIQTLFFSWTVDIPLGFAKWHFGVFTKLLNLGKVWLDSKKERERIFPKFEVVHLKDILKFYAKCM